MNDEKCIHDYDWINPYLDSDNDMDEVLMCLNCGHVMWTARDLHNRPEPLLLNHS